MVVNIAVSAHVCVRTRHVRLCLPRIMLEQVYGMDSVGIARLVVIVKRKCVTLCVNAVFDGYEKT